MGIGIMLQYSLVLGSLFAVGIADQCIVGQRGPACKNDAECTKMAKCIRCAKSGYCTAEPLPGPSPGPHPGPSPGPHGKRGCDTKDHSYDYLLLVQGWPDAFCISSPCHGSYSSMNYWVLHGLWPSRGGVNAASYPCKCSQQQFDESKVKSIEDQMIKFWPSYRSNVPFWGHEYTKHGTCATDIAQLTSEFGFFQQDLGAPS